MATNVLVRTLLNSFIYCKYVKTSHVNMTRIQLTYSKSHINQTYMILSPESNHVVDNISCCAL